MKSSQVAKIIAITLPITPIVCGMIGITYCRGHPFSMDVFSWVFFGLCLLGAFPFSILSAVLLTTIVSKRNEMAKAIIIITLILHAFLIPWSIFIGMGLDV